MAAVPSVRHDRPQSFVSSYAPRLRSYGNSLIAPVVPQANTVTSSRTTKRGTTAINYAEDGRDDDFDDDEEGGRRRPTGLRSLRQNNDPDAADKAGAIAHLGRELDEPVDVQGIWREWMGKPKPIKNRKQTEVQARLPVTLIPIRIDVDIQPFRPEAPLPTPHNARDFGIDETLPAYKIGDLTPQYRIKDLFLWNLHESLITPTDFAKIFVDELDIPTDKKLAVVAQIATQIRTQLEEYAGIALHPLFYSSGASNAQGGVSTALPGTTNGVVKAEKSATGTPRPSNGLTNGTTPAATNGTSTPITEAQPSLEGAVSAKAERYTTDDTLNPDDTYRCIVSLNVNILNRLYSDKFEWSLLHPPGYAESFAKITCADLGLPAEWAPAITHAIYEAVLRLKKEACENGSILTSAGELDNDAAEGVEAGWRYEPERLAEEWEPKIELLSKEEIDRREGDRERQIRRQRRETARFSSTTNMLGGDFFANPQDSDQPLGRGERSKKKRRFRSLSPNGRETPDTAAGYGGGTGLQEGERSGWRCSHCAISGTAVWAVRDGPRGPRSLCHNCGLLYERDKQLPPWARLLHYQEKQRHHGHR